MTASTPGRSMQASRLVDEKGILYSSANVLPLSSVRLAIETTSTPSIFCRALAWMTPIAPVPAKQIFIANLRKARWAAPPHLPYPPHQPLLFFNQPRRHRHRHGAHVVGSEPGVEETLGKHGE